MKEFLLGAGLLWDVDQQVKSNKRRTTMPWTSTCQANTVNVSQCTLMTCAGADTLEDLFELYKALVTALDKAGIQVKASKVEFGVEEITFHNYRIVGGDGPMANTTTPKLGIVPFPNPSLSSKHFWVPPNK